MQNEKKIKLVVLTPQRTLLDVYVDKVTLPASKGQFMVLYNHAPVITSLDDGVLIYSDGQRQEAIEILGGFAEVNENVVTVCAEV